MLGGRAAAGACGQFLEALQLEQETLTTAQRVYGDDHEFTGLSQLSSRRCAAPWATLRPPCR